MYKFTRRALTTHVARSIKAVDVIDQLAPLVAKHGAPTFMRSDNAPECIAAKVAKWLGGQVSALLVLLEPGAPWQNAFIGSFHSRLEEELLADEIFCTLAKAKIVIGGWVHYYNDQCPQRSLGKPAPNGFTAAGSAEHDSAAPLRWPRPIESNIQLLTSRLDQECEAVQRHSSVSSTLQAGEHQVRERVASENGCQCFVVGYHRRAGN